MHLVLGLVILITLLLASITLYLLTARRSQLLESAANFYDQWTDGEILEFYWGEQRCWEEVIPSPKNMVEAAKIIRGKPRLPRNEVWQGYCGYWQNQFIRENLLPLGHAAWQGFTIQGRGMVVCNVAIVEDESVDWNSDIIEYVAQFVPLCNVSVYLQTFNLEATLIERLINTVRTYDPAQQILLLINENGQADINLLQNLAITPLDCYQQMQRRWSEFQLEVPTPRRT
jgi:hypothetical protein